MIKNLVDLIALVLLNYLFYGKRRIFPWGMIAFYICHILVGFAEHVAYAAAFPEREVHLISPTVLRPLVAAAIWVPYLLLSKRVKATFVR